MKQVRPQRAADRREAGPGHGPDSAVAGLVRISKSPFRRNYLSSGRRCVTPFIRTSPIPRHDQPAAPALGKGLPQCGAGSSLAGSFVWSPGHKLITRPIFAKPRVSPFGANKRRSTHFGPLASVKEGERRKIGPLQKQNSVRKVRPHGRKGCVSAIGRCAAPRCSFYLQ